MEVRTVALHAKNPEQFPIAENKRIQKYKATLSAQQNAANPLLILKHQHGTCGYNFLDMCHVYLDRG